MSAEAVKTVIEIGMALEQVKQKLAEKDDRIATLEAEVKRLEEVQSLTYKRAQHLDDRANKAETLVRELVEGIRVLTVPAEHTRQCEEEYRRSNYTSDCICGYHATLQKYRALVKKIEKEAGL